MQLGKFADHVGQQVGLAQLRGALRLGGIGADDRRQPPGERNDARDALGLRTELLVEHDVLEFRQPVFQPRFQIGLVKELGIGQPRADDALVAGDDCLAAIRGFLVGDQDELVGEPGGGGVAQHEAFLVVADGGADHLLGDRQIRRVERTHQRHRPFDQAGDFSEQAVVLQQLIALRESQMLGVGEDQVGAPRRIEHHLGRLELGDVVVEPPHLDRAGRHEAMAARLVGSGDAVHVERDDIRFLGFRPESGKDGMQRAHPGQPAAAPTHRFRPGEAAHHLGDHLRQHVERRAARLLDQRQVEIAFLVGLHFGLVDRRQTRRLEEAGDGLRGRVDARALLLFLDVGLLHRYAMDRECEPARRGEGLGAFVDEPGRHQPVGDHLLQILGRARLHARRDFLRQKFKQQIGHVGQAVKT